MDDNNILLLTDSYKLSHYRQYPPGTEKVYSYFESRRGAMIPWTIFFGLQYILKKYLQGQVVTRDRIDAAANFARLHMANNDQADGIFHLDGWNYILKKHNGHLPVEIKAIPEGTYVPEDNVLMTIENTDPDCYWLTSYLETLLVQVWYPSTVCTISNSIRRFLREALEKSGNLAGLPYKLHDFGFRGASSVESAGIGGLAHLVNFVGTDTIAAIACGINYYDSRVCGFSIPASEHSTITSWGKEHEIDAFRNMLNKYPIGPVACVSDSYDIDKACTEYWGTTLKDKVLARDGFLVVRPDSGPLVETVLNVLNNLGNSFGVRKNSKGYKVLDDHVRVIQGDGCTPETIREIVNAMLTAGWSIDNIAFGMGGGLLQKVNRDTQRFAFKCSHVVVDGEARDVFKQPKTDSSKNSKRGRLGLARHPGLNTYFTLSEEDTNRDPYRSGQGNQLITVFRNGEITRLWTLDEIRKRATI